MIDSIARFILRPVLGRSRYQPLFRALYKLSLAGLNVGQGVSPCHSGEKWLLSFLRQRLPPSDSEPVVFDIGANQGQFVTNAATILGPEVRFWSFEPCLATYEQLTRTISSDKRVTPVRAAVGADDGEIEMLSPVAGSKLASIYNRSDIWHDSAVRERVPMVSLDSFCRREAIERIFLLKIDVEGHEFEVLRGATDLLANSRIDHILFEFSAAHVDSRVFFRDFYRLLSPHFALHRLLRDGLAPISHYSPDMELFKRATNYVGILRSR